MKKKLIRNGFFTVCGYGFLIVALATGCGGGGGGGGGGIVLPEEPGMGNPGEDPDTPRKDPPPPDREP